MKILNKYWFRLLLFRFAPFIAFLLLLFLGWQFLYPKYSEIQKSQRSLEENEGKLVRLENKLHELEGLNESDLSKTMQLSMNAVDVEKKFINVLSALDKIARKADLVLEDFSVSPGSLPTVDRGKLNFKIKLTSDAEKLKLFYTELEKSLPLLTPQGKVVVMFEANTPIEISIEDSFIPLPKTLGNIDSSIPKLTKDEEDSLKTISKFNTYKSEEVIATKSGGRANPFAF